MEWRFDEPQPAWKPAYGYEFSQKPVEPVRTSDALRVVIEEEHVDSDGDLCGYVYTDLLDWQLPEWADVAVEARAQPSMATAPPPTMRHPWGRRTCNDDGAFGEATVTGSKSTTGSPCW